MHNGSVREMDPRGYKLPWRRNFLHVYDYRGYSLILNEIEEQREGTSVCNNFKEIERKLFVKIIALIFKEK